MGADAIHGAIGKKMRKLPSIYNFEDFVNLCASSSKNVKPIVMQFSDFYEVKGENRSRQSKKVTLPKLSDVCEVQFQKGSSSIFYRTSFDEEAPIECPFLRPRFSAQDVPPKCVSVRGIAPSKKEGIVKLLDVCPPSKRKFWHELHENTAANDLVANFE